MSIVTDPRLVNPAPERTIPELLEDLKRMRQRIANKIMALDRGFWPKSLNGEYRVVHRDGKVKVDVTLPAVKEQGYQD